MSIRKTRFPELGYEQHAPGLWRIIALDTGSAVGPHYPSKTELLADLERYAQEYGCPDAARPLAPGLECTLEDYRRAPGGDGPLAAQWQDKPHRLVYDLCKALHEAGFR